jgi:hypothetical protein
LSVGLFSTFLQVFGSENYVGLKNNSGLHKIQEKINLEPNFTTGNIHLNYKNTSLVPKVTRLYYVDSTEYDNNDATTTFDVNCFEYESNENYYIKTYFGNITVSFVLQEFDSAENAVEIIIKKINELGLLSHNTSIGMFLNFHTYRLCNCIFFFKNDKLGVRVLKIIKTENFSEIIENELDYLEHCADIPFGKQYIILCFIYDVLKCLKIKASNCSVKI